MAGTADKIALAEEKTSDLVLSIADYKSQIADATSIGKNFSAIVGYAKTYDTVMTDLSAKEAEYARLRNLGWSETSQKMQTLNGEIEGLKGQLTASANQMTLDMMQATIAIGGVTEAEMGAYFDMAVAMGAVSRQGADAAMAAYQNAVDQINTYAFDPKTVVINVQTNAVDAVLAELEAERIKKQVVEFTANTKQLDDKRSLYENMKTLEMVVDFAVNTLGLDEKIDAYTALQLAMTMGLVGDPTKLEATLKHYKGLVPEAIKVAIEGEWYIPPPPSIGPLSWNQGNVTPQKAIGGPVRKDQPYLVGERGVEAFIPATHGMIVPNDKLSGLGKQVVINFAPEVNSEIDMRAALEELVRMVNA